MTDEAGGASVHGVEVRVIVASTRAARGHYEDRTGPVLVDWARSRGYACPEPRVVEDGEPVGAALREALAASCTVILTTGGTGVTPSDRTPDETAPLVETRIPGIVEAIRARGARTVPTAWLSRGEAGLATGPTGRRTLIVNLPGSRGGVRDGIAVLDDLLPHLLAQLDGGDHDPA
ncbi:MogA/MoaB family molybdenum cofactor biosynthesis protein [Micrococcales bacterium 31B]|nr:MogA/MoaB family molybdenum cofactor biosynthesis protein [Micrococcales bacterium 31B]